MGPQEVKLAQEIDDLDRKIREANSDIKTRKDTMSRVVPTGTTLDTYLAWQVVEDIEAKIERKKAEIASRQLAAEKAAEIGAKNVLSPITLPTLPDDFLSILSKELADVAAGAEARVREQITDHNMGDHGETWLSQGLDFVTGRSVPLQSRVAGSDLISHTVRTSTQHTSH